MTFYLTAILAVMFALVVAGLAARAARRRAASALAALEPVGGGDLVPLQRQRLAVGRQGADIVIPEPTISVLHAEIVHDNGVWSVQDRRSRNGTFVNDERVEEQRALRDGDRIRFAADGPTYIFRCRPAWPQRGRSA